MFHRISLEIQAQMYRLEKIDAQDRKDGTPRLKRLQQIAEKFNANQENYEEKIVWRYVNDPKYRYGLPRIRQQSQEIYPRSRHR